MMPSDMGQADFRLEVQLFITAVIAMSTIIMNNNFFIVFY
jgi:hypothetical protein